MLTFVLLASVIGAEPEPPALDRESMRAVAAEVAAVKAQQAAARAELAAIRSEHDAIKRDFADFKSELKALRSDLAVLRAACGCAPAVPANTEATVKEKKNKTVVKSRTTTAALDQLNLQRAQRGLPPYAFSEALTRAAEKVVGIKARGCISGHLNGPMSDFAYLDPGTPCDATGADGSKIAASDPNFYTCAMYENYRSAGAAEAVGPDGCKYCSLFVSYAAPQGKPVAASPDGFSIASGNPVVIGHGVVGEWMPDGSLAAFEGGEASLTKVQPSNSNWEVRDGQWRPKSGPVATCANGSCQLAPVASDFTQGACFGGSCSTGSCSTGSCSTGSCASGSCASGNCGTPGRRGLFRRR